MTLLYGVETEVVADGGRGRRPPEPGEELTQRAVMRVEATSCDVSASGMRVVLTPAAPLPRDVLVLVGDGSETGILVARVAWERDGEAGLMLAGGEGGSIDLWVQVASKALEQSSDDEGVGADVA